MARYSVFSVVVLLAGLGGCDSRQPAPTEPVTPAPTAAAEPIKPAPVAPPSSAQALASTDRSTFCSLFKRASSDGKKVVSGDGCLVEEQSGTLLIKSADGSSGLQVSLVGEGSIVQLTAENASARAIFNAEKGTFANAGLVFVGQAPATGLCMEVEAFSPNGKSNSLAVTRDRTQPATKFDLKTDAEKTIKADFPEPVVLPGQLAAFALSRRELETGLKSVTFRAC